MVSEVKNCQIYDEHSLVLSPLPGVFRYKIASRDLRVRGLLVLRSGITITFSSSCCGAPVGQGRGGFDSCRWCEREQPTAIGSYYFEDEEVQEYLHSVFECIDAPLMAGLKAEATFENVKAQYEEVGKWTRLNLPNSLPSPSADRLWAAAHSAWRND